VARFPILWGKSFLARRFLLVGENFQRRKLPVLFIESDFDRAISLKVEKACQSSFRRIDFFVSSTTAWGLSSKAQNFMPFVGWLYEEMAMRIKTRIILKVFEKTLLTRLPDTSRHPLTPNPLR
jgi:hypothetical protein